MLYWKANFQIPNSGVQANEVFALAEKENTTIVVNFFSDSELTNFLFEKQFVDESLEVGNLYDYLLSLEYFNQYTKV